MNRVLIDDFLSNDLQTCVISGHVSPDGDCVGSVSALYLYIRKNFPEIDVKFYVERPKESLMFLPVLGEALFEYDEESALPDLFITCDVSSLDRIGVVPELFQKAKRTLCVDHHVSNQGFADDNIIDPDASSCAEVLFYCMDESKIDREIAEALYTGIVHDSGVFQYANTRPETMEAAAALMRKGVNFCDIIENSFNIRTYVQNRVMGYVLSRCRQYSDGQIVTGSITLEEMAAYGADKKDLDMIVSQLRLTQGAEAAVFIYQTGTNEFKVSLRSNSYLDVAEAASLFGGGGHVRAAGFTLSGDEDFVEKKIIEVLKTRHR